mgnify:CR=1 FL=1
MKLLAVATLALVPFSDRVDIFGTDVGLYGIDPDIGGAVLTELMQLTTDLENRNLRPFGFVSAPTGIISSRRNAYFRPPIANGCAASTIAT